jgi:hypothetical protein
MSSTLYESRARDADRVSESGVSAVSWAAILAGAFAAVAITLVLVTLGSGLGLAGLSPRSGSGASGTTFAIATGIGLIVVQWIASGLGGFLAGRLRTKWVGVHSHEVFFRDTVHGFITWALASLFTAMMLATATSSIVGGGVNAAATTISGAARTAGQAIGPAAESASSDTNFSAAGSYGIDMLFRSDRPDAPGKDSPAEAARILANGLRNGDIPSGDRAYLAQLVAARTGISKDEAQKRVDGVIAQANAAEEKVKQAADAARKAAATFSIFTALSMLIGAFIASVAAAYGGSLRDDLDARRV